MPFCKTGRHATINGNPGRLLSGAMTKHPFKIAAVVVAGGRGRRAGDGLPKQYRAIAGISVIRRAIEAMVQGGASTIVPVIHPQDRDLFNAAMKGGSNLPAMVPVDGGDERQDSSLNGLRALRNDAPDLVLIHDAARPFCPLHLVGRIVEALAAHDTVVPVLPVVDTLRRQTVPGETDLVERTGLWRTQTPQGFRFPAIVKAYESLGNLESRATGFTDDAAVAERAGLAVHFVAGDEDNIKLTTPADFVRAEQIATRRHETRIGTGFDVHRFESGAFVTLCGVQIPFTAGLAGHSDADVGWHALTDAILGAMGLGDIGLHFPPGDPAYKSSPSDMFLRHATDLLAKRGGTLTNADITFICEAPKLGPHRHRMIAQATAVLGVDPGRISIKATTTERLGFAGRGEGIAAQACAMVSLPLSSG